ncbi:MAG: response regulator [Candidatus Omnitrophota bacterium]
MRTKRILLVDDEEEVIKHLSNILERAAHKVIATTKGKEAVNLAKTAFPDLIILDIVLPDMEGGEVAAVIGEDPSTANIPIIFLSGIVLTKEDAVSGEKIGRHYVLAKPVTGEELLETIGKVFPDY